MNLRYKAAEILIIFYSFTFILALTLLPAIIVCIPTNAAFPFSYAYTAYLNEYISQYTMYVAFMLEIIFITSFASKITWFFTYLQIYMIVLSSCSQILRYVNIVLRKCLKLRTNPNPCLGKQTSRQNMLFRTT